MFIDNFTFSGAFIALAMIIVLSPKVVEYQPQVSIFRQLFHC
jgi:hypothetical protein